jgi:hypothetical protein
MSKFWLATLPRDVLGNHFFDSLLGIAIFRRSAALSAVPP